MKIEQKAKSKKVEFVKKEKPTDKMIFVRLPPAIRERLDYQAKRLCTSMNMMVRMALIKFLEEEEAKERQTLTPR